MRGAPLPFSSSPAARLCTTRRGDAPIKIARRRGSVFLIYASYGGLQRENNKKSEPPLLDLKKPKNRSR
jgi:hypothetical protein